VNLFRKSQSASVPESGVVDRNVRGGSSIVSSQEGFEGGKKGLDLNEEPEESAEKIRAKRV